MLTAEGGPDKKREMSTERHEDGATNEKFMRVEICQSRREGPLV